MCVINHALALAPDNVQNGPSQHILEFVISGSHRGSCWWFYFKQLLRNVVLLFLHLGFVLFFSEWPDGAAEIYNWENRK